METCFNKVNKCNIYAQCDPVEGSDIAEDELGCDDEYREKGLIPKLATYRCQSPHHNDDSVRNNKSLGVVRMKSVPHDGNLECWNGVRE